MACPFFLPIERVENLALPHPARLPLGAAWRGACTVPGHEHADLAARDLESCNLGYAHTCPRLPNDRPADAVRFAVSKQSPERVTIQFVLETNHLPVGHGSLEYDCAANIWLSSHAEERIQKLADCFVQSYLDRIGKP